jgi:hypothetical protein
MTFPKICRKISNILAAPLYLSYFFEKDIGRDYGLTFLDKMKIVFRFQRNSKKIPAATNWREHLRIAAEILKVPPTVKGDVIECGCYKGGSSANLSLICDIVGRKLVVCDSFEGLPAPEEYDKVHYNIAKKRVKVYEKGDYAGTLEQVKLNIGRFGKIGVCEFVKGYYEMTLKQLDGPYVLAFVDVDLHKSLKECITSLWPRLVKGAHFFSHEANDMAYTSLFFDKEWWKENLDCSPPGLVGSGTGLPLGIAEGSGLGYAIKGDIHSISNDWNVVSFGKE